MEQGAPQPPLGVSSELSIVDCEIRRPDSDPVDGQNAGQTAEQPLVAAFYVDQPGTRGERQDERDVQATGTDHYGAAARFPVQQRHPAESARGHMYPLFGLSVSG